MILIKLHTIKEIYYKQDGQVSSSNFVDYITIDKQNIESKLNINKFIKKETVNRTGTQQGIEVALNTKSVYVDYEIYNMTVTNNTQKTILLNNGRDINNICLVDRYDSIFSSVISEVPISNLTIEPQYKRNINMKFNKVYMTDRRIEAMQIKDIYLDKEQYDNGSENMNRATIVIGL